MTANIHYKICDDGKYTLLGADGSPIVERDGYVPDMLSPAGAGYGDYVIMNVTADGFVENWDADLSYFEDAE